MRAFICALGTETNTFSPIPTGLRTFEETMLFHGDATRREALPFSEPLHAWRADAEAAGMEVAEGLAAFAQPAGTTVAKVYEALRDELLADLKAALPVDIVLVNMHGAMVADGYDDCEGDLLTRIRALAGPDVVIGGELDLHCSVTPEMLAAADVLIAYKEYPHVDKAARAHEVFAICKAAAEGSVRPIMATWDTRMISSWRTPLEPMKSFVARMQALEGKDGVLSVSFAHGFPWGDVPCVTARTLVVTDGDAAKAAALAETLGREIWAMREETRLKSMTVPEAVAHAIASAKGPVVLADVSDNAGGGAPSDSTFILKELLDRGATDFISGTYWDPIAVRLCMEAGEGATMRLRIGGKLSPESGDPIDIEARVKKVLTDAGQTFGGARSPMGNAVWLRMVSPSDDIDLILNDRRTQTFHPDAYTQFGLDPTTKKIVVTKSSQHFYAGFAPIASEVIYCDGPGALNRDMAKIPFRKFQGAFWPKVEDPWG